jgi:hypothetical protein
MAKCVVLEHESREGFDNLLAGFVERFAPTDNVELGLVEEMFSAFWRQRRAWAIETRIMNGAISTQPPDLDELTRLADGFTSIAAQPPLELMHRYETRLHRIFQRALGNLILMRSLQELTPPAENIKLQNEPSPISEQSPAPESEGDPPTPAPPAPGLVMPFPMSASKPLPDAPLVGFGSDCKNTPAGNGLPMANRLSLHCHDN